MLVGIASFWMVYDFPDEATFLSDADRQRVIWRLKADQQSSAEHEDFRSSYFWASVKDWKTYTSAIIYMGCELSMPWFLLNLLTFLPGDGPLYAFSLFLPTIVNAMGYKSTHAQLLSVPPYAVAAVMTITIGFIADRTQQRGLCNMGISIIGILGFGESK